MGYLSTNKLAKKFEIPPHTAFEALEDKGLIKIYSCFSNAEKGWQNGSKQTGFSQLQDTERAEDSSRSRLVIIWIWPECIHTELEDLIQEFNQSRKVISPQKQQEEPRKCFR